MEDVSGIKRYVCGYSKIPDEHGQFPLEVEYELKPLKLSFLQELFNVAPDDPDDHALYDCYRINSKQAEMLENYMIGGVFDFDKYSYRLECSDLNTCTHSEEYLKLIK